MRSLITRLSDNRGLGLPEVLVAATLLGGGLLAAVGTAGGSLANTMSAQRHEIAIHTAQQEIEKLQAFDYSNLAMSAAPVNSGDAGKSLLKVGCHFLPVNASNEVIVYPVAGYSSCDAGESGKVAPLTDFTTTVDGTTVSGRIYRYITFRAEQCADCPGNKSTKRITVGVKLNPPAGRENVGPRRPVWISTIVTNPQAVKPGTAVPPLPEASTKPRNLYLYSQRCGDGDSYGGAPAADRATRSTVNWGNGNGPFVNMNFTSNAPSYCENNTNYNDPLIGSEKRRPDLMGPIAPSGSESVQLHDYSSDLPRSTAAARGGLALRRSGASCTTRPRYMTSEDGSRTIGSYSAPSRWNTHAWSSPPITSELRLRQRMEMVLYAAGAQATSGDVKFCASLIVRRNSGGLVTDDVLVDAAATANNGCVRNVVSDFQSTAPISCRFELDTSSSYKSTDSDGLSYWKIPGDSTYRVMLVLRVAGAPSDDGALLAYDHAAFPSFMKLFCDPDYCAL